ncbi:GMC oxidoreductase [Bradyrhizobium erythrophlei]|uniref:GMC oxidoreductase n=1 Tax=Bradyrhizobium erythrophlei TaxID=1437360 RepID=UPI0035E5AE5F
MVGAGPVGIALALACERHGLSVLVLESGHEQPDRLAATLTAGHVVNVRHHAAADIAMCRGLGGTSRWWGGRCVPFDDVDFARRPHLPGSAWPIPHQEIARWYEEAAVFFGIEPARFANAVAPWAEFGDVRCDRLERWTPEIDAGRRHRSQLAESQRVTVLLGATVTELHFAKHCDRVAALTVGDTKSKVRIEPPRVVLACGGLETTRLLLQAQQGRPHLFGGRDGPLGCGYMGHISGKIADLILADPSSAGVHDFFLDEGVFARRRFTLKAEAQMREELLNIAFWADNPPFHLPGHGNGLLSLVWMALAIAPIGRLLVAEGVRVSHVGPRPHRWARHAWNVLRSPVSTLREITAVLRARLLSSPRRPGFLVRSSDGRYALHYHAEHAPNDSSRLRLSDRRDTLGLPFLDIELLYAERDAQSVLRAHELLDRSLRRAGLGHLEYREPPEARITSILQQAADGYHQTGTTRMGMTPKDGVVDATCRVQGIDNLYISSSSVFPTSGQANPTFATVALAIRLATHLAAELRKSSLEPAA